MGTVTENLATWNNYPWPQAGDEWSALWGGTEFLWWGTLFPRIQALVPTGVILEIAPGFGRCTHYLKDYCQHLAVVDLTERCIEACKQRFAAYSHISYYVNDGTSLAMIPDRSIDFVFSFDSLVHAEADVIEVYLQQLSRKLRPNGVGFIHHSNIGAFRDHISGQLAFDNIHWRAETMTAALFEKFCTQTGLQCIGQELINWGGSELIDCFSLFTLKNSTIARENKIIENTGFMDEIARMSMLSQLYKLDYHPDVGSVNSSAVPTSLIKKMIATVRRSGPKGLLAETLRYLTWRLERQPAQGVR